MTVGELLSWGRERLGDDGNEGDRNNNRNESEALLSAVTGQSTATLIAHAERPVAEHAVGEFQSLLERRAGGEPLAYLLGEKEFWSLMLAVTSDVLIPRPETELLVEEVLARASHRKIATILELGTGSGAIALALASELPHCTLVATDISPAALEVAERNAQKLDLQPIEFCLGDWFCAVAARRFDLIVANPPYIAPGDPHLRRGDVRFEPDSALVSAANGLADLERIIANAASSLNGCGELLVEHGWEQGAAVRALFEQNRFAAIATRRDLGGNERVTGGRIKPAG